jgi:gamma-glutamylputrescine oxidase
MKLQQTWQSPIAPGLSLYQATVGDRETYPALDGSRRADVAIIGGGYTGLQAAYTLAKAGVDIVLIDANRFGDGARKRCSILPNAPSSIFSISPRNTPSTLISSPAR